MVTVNVHQKVKTNEQNCFEKEKDRMKGDEWMDGWLADRDTVKLQILC